MAGAIAVLLRDGAEEEALSSKPFRRRHVRLGNDSVEVTIGFTRSTTSLFPKDGRYVVPLKSAIRKLKVSVLATP